ncbi:GNAT family N-acetyltransferase [Erysipelothrix aquatica]|uniref:GNAT family N-acetyltransferase n=1 Tax=Erysipelothrix aquatica TaxID=2683714 RepID=UPI00135C1043|nr:GNAT family N-acetyltransferase [Erysipelothrix aquatica]
MLSLKKITDTHKMDIETLYINAFPENERKNLNYIYDDKGANSEICVLLDDDCFVGFTIVLFTDTLVHLIYFAIDPKVQSKGLGSATLALIKERYQRTIFADVEVVRPKKSDAPIRRRRIKFYKKNHYNETKIVYNWRGEEFTILSTDYPLTAREYHDFWETLEKNNPKLLEY